MRQTKRLFERVPHTSRPRGRPSKRRKEDVKKTCKGWD